MNNYPSNSNKSKEKKKDSTVAARPKTQSVVTGKVETKKKSDFQKYIEAFAPVALAVLIPAGKKAISDIVDSILYPDGGSGQRNNFPASKITYNKMYRSSNDRRDDYRIKNAFDYDNIVFHSRGDAEMVLTTMEEIISEYGTVCVGDLYDLANISTSNYSTQDYGWSNLATARVVPVRDGYVLKLPKALPLK